jgi:hypothetical protein
MNTTLVFCLISFALSIDYSLALISLEAYWIKTGGAKSLSGVAFGIYDCSTIFLTPMIAWFINNKNLRYKTVFKTGLLVNIGGNIIYSLAYQANSWMMILLGRGIAGMGAATFPLLMVYIADKMDMTQQQSVVGYVKYIAAITRVVGPIMGSIFSATIKDGSFFNLYTLVGWVPICISLITLIVLYFWEENTTEDTADNNGFSFWTTFGIFWPVLVSGFVSTFIYWLFTGNIFLIATHYFHVVHNEHELGRLYYAGLVGFVLAVTIFMCFKEAMSTSKGMWMSTILLSITTYVYIFDTDIMFHLAVGLTTLAYGLTIPSINYLNNVLAKNFKFLLGKSMGVSITLLNVVQSLARFIGPSCFSLFLTINESTDCNTQSKDNYITSGCSMKGFVHSSIIYTTASAVLMLISAYYLLKKVEESKQNKQYIAPLNSQV